jgi:hypothetical protein
MSITIACPDCGEEDDLVGTAVSGHIRLHCGACDHEWSRSNQSECSTCGGTDLQVVPLAIVERSRGTQLSILGTRPVTLCSACDRETLRHYHAHRPSPLMPTELPTMGEEHMNG